jgi:hypothetical protein
VEIGNRLCRTCTNGNEPYQVHGHIHREPGWVCQRGGGGGTNKTRKMQAKNAARNAKTRGTVEMAAKKPRRALGGKELMVTGHHLHTCRPPHSPFVLQTGPSQATNASQPTPGVSHTGFWHTRVSGHASAPMHELKIPLPNALPR